MKAMTVAPNKRAKIELEEETAEEGEWAWLPCNIHDLIIDKLVSLADYICYGAVCKSWLKVILENCNHRGYPKLKNVTEYNHNHQLPMLMIPHRFDKNIANFYSVTREQMLKFELSVPYHQRFIGSSFGWLISVDSNFVITLFNPFLSEGNNVHYIPPLGIDVSEESMHNFDDIIFNHEYYIVKAVLSADPNLHPDDYALLIIYTESNLLAMFTPQNKPNTWVYLWNNGPGFYDVIYSSGEFYALCDNGEVWISKFQTLGVEDDKRKCKTKKSLSLNPDSSCFARYIVEGAKGEILQVLRHGQPSMDGFPSCLTTNFEVFKLNNHNRNWVELKSLGDQVLFVGDNSSLSVLASDYPGCQPGSIYYSFGFHPDILNRNLSGGFGSDHCDTGVFNLEKGRSRPHTISYDDILCYAMHQFPPLWLVPTFRAPNLCVSSTSSLKS